MSAGPRTTFEMKLALAKWRWLRSLHELNPWIKLPPKPMNNAERTNARVQIKKNLSRMRLGQKRRKPNATQKAGISRCFGW